VPSRQIKPSHGPYRRQATSERVTTQQTRVFPERLSPALIAARNSRRTSEPPRTPELRQGAGGEEAPEERRDRRQRLPRPSALALPRAAGCPRPPLPQSATSDRGQPAPFSASQTPLSGQRSRRTATGATRYNSTAA